MLHDPALVFIIVLAGAVSMLTTLNVAARPAAVTTRRVATAFTVAQLFFMVTRFANMFYVPLMARFVDEAERTGEVGLLYGQIQWVILGAAAGALAAWLLLPTFIELYRLGVQALEHRSMVRALLRLAHPRSWLKLLRAFRLPSNLGTRLFRLEGVPADFLVINVVATAIWTVGALCAIYVSAILPQYAATAALLSGLVNAFAAIAFSVWVDPRASTITDQAVSGDRDERDVRITAVHLSAGNFVGALLGLAVFPLGIELVRWATLSIGSHGGDFSHGLWFVVLLNVIFAMLASTTYSARVSAVLTRRVATAIAVYNLFFLVTRLAGQVYAPILGSMADHVVQSPEQGLASLEVMFRWVLGGASLGALLGWLLMPTFIEVYNHAVRQLDRAGGSFPEVFWRTLAPRRWGVVLGCLRWPSTFGITLADVRRLPQGFLWGNVLVLAVHTIGVMAAIYAGAQLSESLSRTATLLSSVVNGVATITLSVIVDPTTARITDRCVDGERPEKDIYAMALALMAGMFVGTLFSQLLLTPAAWVIAAGAHLLDLLF